MQQQQILQLISDFFTVDKEVSHPGIPELKEWKDQYFLKLREMENSSCPPCARNNTKLMYSHMIKHAVYSRKL